MISNDRERIVFHGAAVLIVGLLCGFPFAAALTGNWGDEPLRAWRFAHLGLIVTGIWLLATAAVLPSLVLGRRPASVLVWSLLGAAYGFMTALLVAAVSGVRGLQPTGPAANWVAFAANTFGALGGLVGAALTLLGARAALRRLRAS